MRTLFIIPARGGSKGIPEKNIKYLGGKSLIFYTIDVARAIAKDEDIFVSTEDDTIIKLVESYGLKIPFKRPEELATDTTGTYEVLLHAIEEYKQRGFEYDAIVLLQPTSPFRKIQHVKEAIGLFRRDIDMVVSVKETKSNPYYTLFEENKDGFLQKSKAGDFITRQSCPQVWEYNGAVFVINIKSLNQSPLHRFKKIIKYEMDEISSHDIDTPLDLLIAECIIEKFGYKI